MRAQAGEPAMAGSRRMEPWVAAGLALVAFAVLPFAALARYPLWGDETWTLDVGDHPFARAMRLYADDQTHPPLFYAMLWAWRRLGPDAVAWLHLLPCLAGVATAIPVLALARRARLTTRATLLAILLCAGSGILVAYSNELRDYSLLALAGTTSLAVWLRAREETGASGLRALTIVNGIVAYSHYFGLFVILGEWCDAALWARDRLKAMTVSAVISVAVLLPWVAETIERAVLTGHRLEVLDWLQRPRLADLLDLPRAALGESPWPAVDLTLIVAGAAAVGLWVWRRRGTSQTAAIRLLVLAIAIPVGVSFVASVTGPRPMWLDRYLIATVPPMLVLVAGAMDGLAGPRASATAGLVVLALVPAGLTTASLVRGRQRPRYDLVVRDLARREPASVVAIVAGDPLDAGPLAYASRAAGLSQRVRISTEAPSGVRADSGWYVWSEAHPPAGITPPAALIRDRYEVSVPLQFAADRDALSAVHFARRSSPSSIPLATPGRKP